MVLPEWLVEAKSGLDPAVYGWREQGTLVDVMAGDLVLVGDMDASDDSRRVVAVLDVDTNRRSLLAVLVTNDVSLAGADDLILDPGLTGLPYQVAVLARLPGYLWMVQVDERLGALTDEALDAVMAGYVGAEDPFQNARRGVPLQDRSRDLRWSDLEAEAELVHELRRLHAQTPRRGDSTPARRSRAGYTGGGGGCGNSLERGPQADLADGHITRYYAHCHHRLDADDLIKR